MSTKLLPTSSLELDLSKPEPQMKSTVQHEILVTFKQGAQALAWFIVGTLFLSLVVYVAIMSQPAI